MAQWSVGGRPLADASGSVFAHGGYTEAATLVLLCAQTGVLGMRAEQKAFLLGLVLFIVLSALLQVGEIGRKYVGGRKIRAIR